MSDASDTLGLLPVLKPGAQALAEAIEVATFGVGSCTCSCGCGAARVAVMLGSAGEAGVPRRLELTIAQADAFVLLIERISAKLKGDPIQ